jgi:broad specificity phosphatase PhoE
MEAAGCWIDAFFSDLHAGAGAQANVCLWTGPSRSARESADGLQQAAGAWIAERREHLLLGDQQLGLFEGLSADQRSRELAADYAHYARCEATQGRFWARFPGGESRFDVAARVHQSFVDLRESGADAVVVVCPPLTLLAFVMMWCRRTPEWLEAEPSPKCGGIRHIDGARDRGYIFEGF